MSDRQCCGTDFDAYHLPTCPTQGRREVRSVTSIVAGTAAQPPQPPQAGSDAEHAQRITESLSDWWMQIATGDMAAVVPKAVEYGSADLKIMGEALISLHPNVDGMSPDERITVGQEMAIAFYLLGKVSRLFGAYERGGRPSDDTWHDVSVYSMMGRRVRHEGGWPE